MNSILGTIKHMLGPAEGYDYFDTDIIVHINAAFSRLTTLGVGPKNGYKITGADNTWDEFIADDRLENVKSYVYYKVKLGFDTPANSSHISMIKEKIAELEWLLAVQAETPCFIE